jgi:triosephosphate isomerase (TIM)
MTRKSLIAGNWKMFKTPPETTAFFQQFLPLVASASCDVVICPPFIDLAAAIQSTNGSNVSIGGQNLYWEREGAFTGEVSGPMLKTAGCAAVIVGHSERRQYFGETDATVLQRTRAALASGLMPIVCVGEVLEERESGLTEKVLARQFEQGLAALDAIQFAQVAIAYEPVWAIGTGKVATPEQAEQAHAFLRLEIRKRYGADLAEGTRILYGGSVKPDNAAGLMAKPNIDGALVGGASLDPVGFAKIVHSVAH